ncbi:MAG: MFS transporter [Acetobacteraceae bacterium]
MFTWFGDLTARERRTMIACFGGWALDALDVMMFAFVIPTLIAVLHLTVPQAGELATITLVISAFGGWIAGALADRFGRVRVLQVTIAWYAVFTFLCGLAQTPTQLFWFRAIQGLGFGGEWAAGAVLMGEVIRDKYRGRAVGIVQTGWSIGWGAAALLYTLFFAIMPKEIAWRAMFFVGILPAFLVFYIRRFVEEPEIHREAKSVGGALTQIFAALKPPYLSTTWKVALMVTGSQGGSYVLTIWLPTYLKTVKHMSAVGTGGYLLVLILGAFFGFVSGAYLADGIGRKATFMVSAIGSSAVLLVFMLAPIGNGMILLVSFIMGYISLMMFSPMGAFMTELFPTEVRGAGQGFCYNAGRGMGAVFPVMVGFLAHRFGLGPAIAGFGVVAYAIMILGLLMLPETRGRAAAEIRVAG